jgi:hypothetical protein
LGGDSNETMKELYLTSLVKIEKNELVACFTSREINSNSHYIRHNTINPNCYIEGNEVFTSDAIQPNTELTVNFDGSLI